MARDAVFAFHPVGTRIILFLCDRSYGGACHRLAFGIKVVARSDPYLDILTIVRLQQHHGLGMYAFYRRETTCRRVGHQPFVLAIVLCHAGRIIKEIVSREDFTRLQCLGFNGQIADRRSDHAAFCHRQVDIRRHFMEQHFDCRVLIHSYRRQRTERESRRVAYRIVLQVGNFQRYLNVIIHLNVGIEVLGFRNFVLLLSKGNRNLPILYRKVGMVGRYAVGDNAGFAVGKGVVKQAQLINSSMKRFGKRTVFQRSTYGRIRHFRHTIFIAAGFHRNAIDKQFVHTFLTSHGYMRPRIERYVSHRIQIETSRTVIEVKFQLILFIIQLPIAAALHGLRENSPSACFRRVDPSL